MIEIFGTRTPTEDQRCILARDCEGSKPSQTKTTVIEIGALQVVGIVVK
jgi:hypothetical protein